MTSTTAGHRLVRGYLRDLDEALAALPAWRASELREQIIAHLEDSLPPGTGDHEVAEVLRRLGPPAELAAAEAEPAAARRLAPRRDWRRLPRIAWPLSALIAVLVVGAGYLLAVQTAPALQPAGASIWWYPVDRARQTSIAEPTGESVSSVPIRSGQLQGFVITVQNTSDWTQTVLGPAADFVTPGGSTGIQIAAGGNRDIDRGGLTFGGVRFTTPGSIPPHQIRALRVLWRSTSCLLKGSSGLINQLLLEVRVGGVTRTETVTMDSYWQLSGPSSPPSATAGGNCG